MIKLASKMQQQMNQNQFYGPQPGIIPSQRMQQLQRPRQPQKPHGKKRYHWEIMTVPAAIILSATVVNSFERIMSWSDLLDCIGIQNKTRFTTLFVLGVLACTICAIARVLGDSKKGTK